MRVEQQQQPLNCVFQADTQHLGKRELTTFGYNIKNLILLIRKQTIFSNYNNQVSNRCCQCKTSHLSFLSSFSLLLSLLLLSSAVITVSRSNQELESLGTSSSYALLTSLRLRDERKDSKALFQPTVTRLFTVVLRRHFSTYFSGT